MAPLAVRLGLPLAAVAVVAALYLLLPPDTFGPVRRRPVLGSSPGALVAAPRPERGPFVNDSSGSSRVQSESLSPKASPGPTSTSLPWSGRNSSLPRATPLTSGDLALCLIVKDDLDLEEWVEYHLALGVGRVYLFDDNSTHPPLLPVVHRFISSGHVVYRYLSDPLPPHTLDKWAPNKQLFVYRQCIREFGEQHVFMGFIDSDEFIVLRNPADRLLDILERYRNYGGLTLNWMMFGSSGHITRPAGGVLRNYHKCFPNFHVKSIVNLRRVKNISGDPHHFRYETGYFAVDARLNKLLGPFNPGLNAKVPSYLFETIYLNHYFTKSKEEFLIKVKRGRPDVSTPRSQDAVIHIDSECTREGGLVSKPSISSKT